MKMIRWFIHLAGFFIALAFYPVYADNGIGVDNKAYGKEIQIISATQNGDIYETVTGRVLMDGTLLATTKLFSDIDGLLGWVENLTVVKEMGMRSLTDRTIYMRFSAPAGFDDRDGLMRFIASKESRNVILLAFEDIPSFQVSADAVRMKEVRGRFRVEQLSKSLLAVEFRLHYDSNAKPLFLANLNVKQQVKQTLIRMRQRMENLHEANPDGALARALGLE